MKCKASTILTITFKPHNIPVCQIGSNLSIIGKKTVTLIYDMTMVVMQIVTQIHRIQDYPPMTLMSCEADNKA